MRRKNEEEPHDGKKYEASNSAQLTQHSTHYSTQCVIVGETQSVVG